VDATLTGGDPYPDLQAARATLREVHARWPRTSPDAREVIVLLVDWARLSIQEGRELPLEEGEPEGKALLEASPTAVSRALLSELRAFRGVFALQRGERARGDALFRDGVAGVRALLASPVEATVRRELARLAEARAWATRDGRDAAEAEALAREHLRVAPNSPLGLRLLAGALLARAELAPEPSRGPLLAEVLTTLDAATAAGAGGPVLLALRGRARERLQAGSGAADLAEARRLNPRLLLLQGQ
jgi:hypothetical protein